MGCQPVRFRTEPEWRLLGARGYLQRTHRQFHWENAGYETFDDFLGALSSRKRKVIRREREDALANGISVHWLTGAELTESVWDAFFDFYMETGSRKWGRPYLTRAFFSLVGESMAKDVLLVMAKRQGRWIAGAINFIGSDTLFGRNWGAIEHHPFLHFEVCYYQAIDFAIRRGLGEFARGFGYIGALTPEIFVDGAAQTGVGDVVRGVGRLRQISARDLVLALRTRLDDFQAALNRKVDGLIVADLEMQERMMFDRAPVAAE